VKKTLLFLPAILLAVCSCASPQQTHYSHGRNQTAQTLPAPVPQSQVSATQFTMGSTPSEVAAVMGTPTSVYDFGYRQTWYYGFSRVTFKNGAVSEWSNIAGNLRVVYPGAASAYAQPNRNQTPALYTQPVAVAGNRSSRSQYAQPNPGLTPTLHPGSAVAENGSYYGEPNKVGIPKTVRVRGYYRKDGTYVPGHFRSRPTGRTKKLTR
jgi:outer membrane protein assembly factor BamE (lipoprotein component of BamABCDE complex)